MLKLTREQNEAIIIGGNVRVSILRVNCGRVWLGVDAPREIVVDREEVHNAKVLATKLANRNG